MRSKKSAKGEITEEMSKRVDTGMEVIVDHFLSIAFMEWVRGEFDSS